MLTLVVLLGALAGGAVFWLGYQLVAPRPSLLGALQRVQDAPVPVRYTGPARQVGPGIREQVMSDARHWVKDSRVMRAVVGEEIIADLRILGITPATHYARTLIAAVLVLLLVPWPAAALASMLGWPWLISLPVTVMAAMIAVIAPNGAIRSRARRRRTELMSTLSAFLNLVSMRVASGAAVPTALREASQVGEGLVWRMLRAKLEDARLNGQSPSRGLAALSHAIQVPELGELANQLDLTDVTGAPAEETLRGKSAAIRAKEVTDMLGEGAERTMRLTIGPMLLGAGYLLMLMYPLLRSITTT